MTAYKIHGPDRSAAPDLSWSSILDGRVYRFRLRYIGRSDAWDIAISTASGEVIVDGIRVSEGVGLFDDATDERLPPGRITCVDSLGAGLPPTRNDWRERHYLRYDTASSEVVDNELTSEVGGWIPS